MYNATASTLGVDTFQSDAGTLEPGAPLCDAQTLLNFQSFMHVSYVVLFLQRAAIVLLQQAFEASVLPASQNSSAYCVSLGT